jgi:hypothetical protein
MEGKAFRKLIVWKRAHFMTLAIYKASEKYPRHEVFGITALSAVRQHPWEPI